MIKRTTISKPSVSQTIIKQWVFFLSAVCILLISATPAHSQQLPVTGGLVLWLDANDVSTMTVLSGDIVSEWRDKSGSGNHASQGTSGQQPIFINLGRKNSLNLLRFDGLNDGLTNNTLTGYLREPTMYGVYQGSVGLTSGSNARVLKIGNDGIHDVYIGTNSQTRTTPRATAGIRYNTNTSVFIQGRGGSPLLNSLRLIEYYNSGTNYQQLNINQGSIATETRENTGSTAGFPGANNYTIAKHFTTSHFSGDIAELIIFNRVLSNQERNLIKNYLNAKRLLYGSESLLTGQATGVFMSGQTITYTLQYRTRGPDNATGIISVELPQSMTGVSSTPSRSSISGKTITRSGVSMLTGTTGSIILTAQIISGVGEMTYITTGYISGSSIDSDMSNNTIIILGQQIYPTADLAVSTISSTGVVQGGQYMSHMIQYINSSNTTVNNITIQTVLPSGFTYASSSLSPSSSGMGISGNTILTRIIPSTSQNITGTIIITGQIVSHFKTTLGLTGLQGRYDASRTSGLVFSGNRITNWKNKALSGIGDLNNIANSQGPYLSGNHSNNKDSIFFNQDAQLSTNQDIAPTIIATIYKPLNITGQIFCAGVVAFRNIVDRTKTIIVYYDGGLVDTYCNQGVFGYQFGTVATLVQRYVNSNPNTLAHTNYPEYAISVLHLTGISSTGRTISLGRDYWSGINESRRFLGNIAEVLIYTGAQNSNTINTIHRYLNRKYFIAGSSPQDPEFIITTTISGQVTDNTINNNSSVQTIQYQPTTDLRINTISNTGTYNPTSLISRRIEYNNLGQDAAAGARIQHERSTGISFLTSSYLGILSGNTISFVDIIASKNQTGTIIVTGIIHSGVSLSQIYWTGSIISPLQDTSQFNNTSTGVISINTVDLSINKSVSGSIVSGGLLRYTLSYINNSAYTVTDIQIIDTLSAGLSGISASLTPTTSTANTYTRSFASLGPSQTGQIILTAQIITGIVGTNLSNIASIGSSFGGDNDTTNNISIVSNTLPATSDLAINVIADKYNTYPGDMVTYYIFYSNEGPYANTGINISFQRQSGFNYLSGSGGGVMSGLYSYTRSGLSLNTSQSGLLLISLQDTTSGSSISINYSWTGMINSISILDPLLSNNISTGVTTIGPVPDLRISQSSPPSTGYAGSPISTIIRYGNSGTQTATGILISWAFSGIQNIQSNPNPSRSGSQSLQRDIVSISPDQSGTIIISGIMSNISQTSGSVIVNNATIQQDGGLKMDGINEHIQLSTNNTLQTTSTLSACIYARTVGLSNDIGSFARAPIVILDDVPSRKFFIQIGRGATGTPAYLAAGGFKNDGSSAASLLLSNHILGDRYIICGGVSPSKSILYRHNISKNITDYIEGTGGVLNTGYSGRMRIGSRPVNYVGYHPGEIYDVKMFNTLIDSGNIRYIFDQYQGTKIPTNLTNNTIVDRRFNDMTGLILRDTSPTQLSGALINYTTGETSLGITNKWVDILGNPLTSIASYESNVTNNTSIGSITINPSQDVGIRKTSNTGFVQIGDQIGYTIIFSGRGPDTGTVTIIDYLSSGQQYLTSSLVPISSGSSSTGSRFSFDGGMIGSGSSGSLILTALVLSGNTQSLINTAAINSSIIDPILSNNTSSISITPITTNTLITNIISTGGVYGGDQIGYEIQYANSGNITAKSVTVSASLLSGVIFQSSNPSISSTGTNASGDTIIYRNLGDLSPFQTGSVFFTGRIIKRFTNSFIPSSILFRPTLQYLSGLLLWLDADDTSAFTTGAGNTISQWRDKSGNGNHASQGTTSRQPTLVYNSAISKNSVRFDGGDFLSFPTNFYSFDTNRSFSIIALIKPTSIAQQTVFNNGQGGNGYYYEQGSTYNWNGGHVRYGILYPLFPQINIDVMNTIIATPNSLRTKINNNSTGYTFGSLPTVGGGTTPSLGGRSSLNFFFSGLISEFLIYNTALSTGEQKQLDGYIGLQASSGLVTKASIYTDSFDSNNGDDIGYISQQYIDNSDLNISISYTGFSSGSIKINRYTITIGNSGREDNGLFELSFGWSSGFILYQGSGGGLSGTSLYTWTGLSLSKDASLQRTIDIIKTGSLLTQLIYRTGYVTSPQTDRNLTNNTITGLNYDIYAGTGDLSVIKTASTGAVYLGDIFSYTIAYSNSGDTLFNVSVIDTLAAGLQLISTSPALSTTGFDGSGNTIVTWSGLTIPGNSSGYMILTAQVASRFPPILPSSGLQLRIDVDDASSITLSGGKVSQINDKSGKGRHATQTSGTRMPFYVSSGEREYMSFSGIQRIINTAFTGVHTKTRATKLIHLIRGNQTTLCGGTCPNMNAFGIGNLNLTTQFFAGGYFDRINGAQYSIPAGNMPATNNYVITTTYRGSSGFNIRINGIQLFNNASAVSSINGIGYEIGAYYGWATANNLWQGQVGEVMVYDRILSTGEINTAESYLINKRQGGKIIIGGGILNTVNISGSYDPNSGNNNSSILIDYLPSSSVSITGTSTINSGIGGQIIAHTRYRTNQGPDGSGPMILTVNWSTGYIFNNASITGVTSSSGGVWSVPSLGTGQTGSFTITGMIQNGINPEQTSSIIITGFILPSIIDFDTSDNEITSTITLLPSTLFIKTQIQNRAGGDQTTTGRVGIYSGQQFITGAEISLNSAGISQLTRSLSGIYTIIIEGGSTLAVAKEEVLLSPGYINIDFTTGNIAGGFLSSEFYGYFARDGDIIKGSNTREGRNYINSLDLESLLNQFTPGTSFDPRYDLNKDNKINSADITILIGNYYESGYGWPLEYDF